MFQNYATLEWPRAYNLTEKEIAKYNPKHRHLAYEMRNIKGSRQSPMTDICSLGYTLKSVAHFQHIASLKLTAHKMKDDDPTHRLSLNAVLCDINKLIQYSCFLEEVNVSIIHTSEKAFLFSKVSISLLLSY